MVFKLDLGPMAQAGGGGGGGGGAAARGVVGGKPGVR